MPGSATALPLLLLVAGLPLAFLATGLRFAPIARGAVNVPAFFVWLGTKLHMPDLSRFRFVAAPTSRTMTNMSGKTTTRRGRRGGRGRISAWHVRPEPIAATRLAERAKSRVKREAARREATGQAAAASRRSICPPANTSCRRWGFCPNPFSMPITAHSPTRRWKKMPACWRRCCPISACAGRIVAVRPGPVVTLYEFEPAAGVKSSRVISAWPTTSRAR